MGEKGWGRIRDRLERGFRWKAQYASRKNKGRAMGGMVIDIRAGIEAIEGHGREEMEGIMVSCVKLGGDWWRVVGVYVNGDLERKLQRMRVWMGEGREY